MQMGSTAGGGRQGLALLAHMQPAHLCAEHCGSARCRRLLLPIARLRACPQHCSGCTLEK